MVNSVYIYLVDLPTDISEMVTPCVDGFTVYINARQSQGRQIEAYRHAMGHIYKDDWKREDVQAVESEAHREDH